MIHGETGQAFILAVMSLALGALVITPFLGHAGSSLIGSRVYEQGVLATYSCDSGIEYAIWNLQSGAVDITEGETEVFPAYVINDNSVEVTIQDLGSQVYLVTATATDSEGYATTIESYVSYGGEGWSSDGDIDEDTEGDVYIDGDASIEDNVTVDGSVYAIGDVTLANNAEVTGDVVAGGDLEMANNGIILGDVAAAGDLIMENNSEIGSLEVGGNVCAGGNIYLENNTTIYGSIYTAGNIDINGNAVIEGDVFTSGDVATIIVANNARIEGNVYVSGSVTDKIQMDNNARIYGDVYALGTINNIIREGNILGDVYEEYGGTYPSHPDCLEMPEPGGGAGIIAWE